VKSGGFNFSFNLNKTLFTLGTAAKAVPDAKQAPIGGNTGAAGLMTASTSSLIEEQQREVTSTAAAVLNQAKGFSFQGTPKAESTATATSSSAVPFSFTMPTTRSRRVSIGEKGQPSPRKSSGGAADDGDYASEEELEIYFKPIIPFPPLVELKIGEEDEETVYSHRAKLYRWGEDKEWKERGLGDVKIMRNKITAAITALSCAENNF
jgi:hypothetical protein